MLKNFFRTAFRNILKYKAYSVINFIGLTCGLALSLLIISYVRSELSYDRFQEKLDRMYRIRYDVPNGLKLASTPPPLAPKMKEEFPEIEAIARMYPRSVSISLPGKQEAFEESDIYFSDSTIFNIMTFEFVSGSPEESLRDKFTLLINEEMATKYFGDKDPVGETLIFSGKHPFKIVGVVKNFPENSHLRFNMMAPYENMYDLENEASAKILRQNLDINYAISHSYTYVLLKAGADPSKIDQGMDALLKKHALPQLLLGQIFTLQPVKDIHLKSELQAEPSPPNNLTNIYIFVGVGILTLIIACINYINLSTAQSFTRIKEIGIRKILGSMKYQLIVQFLAESFLFCLVSMVLAYAVFYTLLPLLNNLTDKHLVFSQVVDYNLLTGSLILLLVITFLAGGYPAYFITQFESIRALKGGGTDLGNQWLRKVLVVFQLAIACALVSGSLLIVKQMNYLSGRPLGFQKEHVVNIPLYSTNLNGIFRQNDSTFRVRLQTFRDEVETQTGVIATALSATPPGLGGTYRGTLPEGYTQEDILIIANMPVDYDFLKTYGVEVVAGRGFSRDYGTDVAEGFMINESAVREFNWGSPEEAIGKTMNREGKIGKVIGVFKDFHYESLERPIGALIMEMNTEQFNTLSIRFQNAEVQQVIEKLETSWNRLFPEKSFQFTFLEEQLTDQYAAFQNFGTIIQAFTIIAILISCLGVYGLVLFVVQRKVKEIGVRKVLGASLPNILALIYKDFAWLLGLGFLFGIPVSYYLMQQWLTNFTYHTTPDVLTYLLSLALVVGIVLMTISYQAIKASLANPVSSLRSE